MMLPIGNNQGISRGTAHCAPTRYDRRGLSLVEVLLAVSILAFGIAGVLRGYASSIAVLEAGQDNIQAVSFLRAKMAEVELFLKEQEEIIPSSESGVWEGPLRDFSWRWEVSSTDEDRLYKLALVVSSEDNPRQFSLMTYVADQVEEGEGEAEE